jgi:hypothetical protein
VVSVYSRAAVQSAVALGWRAEVVE